MTRTGSRSAKAWPICTKSGPSPLMQISQKCHERYLEALAPVESTTTLGQATETVCQRTTFHGRSARALNPLAESDARLLQTICRGEFGSPRSH